MRKYLYSFIALGALLYTSCSTEMPEEAISQTREIPQSIVVNFESDTRVHLENGKTFEIEAPENSASNYYIDAMKLNGKNYTRNYITHGDLMKGGKMSVKMSDKPNTKRGTDKADRPYSFSNEK